MRHETGRCARTGDPQPARCILHSLLAFLSPYSAPQGILCCCFCLAFSCTLSFSPCISLPFWSALHYVPLLPCQVLRWKPHWKPHSETLIFWDAEKLCSTQLALPPLLGFGGGPPLSERLKSGIKKVHIDLEPRPCGVSRVDWSWGRGWEVRPQEAHNQPFKQIVLPLNFLEKRVRS